MGSTSLRTVATFGSPVEARLAQTRLQEAGLTAFVHGEETGTTLWYVGTALGGVTLQVPEADLERAAEILRSQDQSRAAAAWTCPACGSEVDAGFEVCWSCGASGEENPQPETAHPALAEEMMPSGTDPPRADELLDRAWRASLFGLVILPGILHLYSATLLAKHRSLPGTVPSDWRATAAAWINTAMVLFVFGILVWLLT